MDCDLWVKTWTPLTTLLRPSSSQQLRYPSGSHSQPEAKTVSEIINGAEETLISVGDYMDGGQFRPRNVEEVREGLGRFLPKKWLTTTPIMCILSLLEWGEMTKVIPTKDTHFDSATRKEKEVERKKLLEAPVWPIARRHTRVIIPHNVSSSHWVLLVVDIPGRTLRYYDSLGGYDLNFSCDFVLAQIDRVNERFGRKPFQWGPYIDGVS